MDVRQPDWKKSHFPDQIIITNESFIFILHGIIVSMKYMFIELLRIVGVMVYSVPSIEENGRLAFL